MYIYMISVILEFLLFYHQENLIIFNSKEKTTIYKILFIYKIGIKGRIHYYGNE